MTYGLPRDTGPTEGRTGCWSERDDGVIDSMDR